MEPSLLLMVKRSWPSIHYDPPDFQNGHDDSHLEKLVIACFHEQQVVLTLDFTVLISLTCACTMYLVFDENRSHRISNTAILENLYCNRMAIREMS